MTRQIDRPEPGYWAVRLRRGAVEVGAAIVWVHTTEDPDDPTILMERSPFLVGYINEKVVHWDEIWLRRGRPIDRAEYDFLIADRKWAKWHAPELPEARPDRRVDLNELQPLF